ncbi:MAG: hypothetical protein KF900_14235 [Bacteroidetes bacterium]|nr:hypothetical protein [Bacteroidota bacterium]
MYKKALLGLLLLCSCKSAKQQEVQQVTRLSLREDGFYYRQHGTKDDVEFLKFFDNGRVLDKRRAVHEYVYKSYANQTICWLQDTTGDNRGASIFSNFKGTYPSDSPELFELIKSVENETHEGKDYNFMMCSYRIKKDSLFFTADKNMAEFIPYSVSFACKMVKDSLICKMTAVDYDTVEYKMPVTTKIGTFVFKQAACDSSVKIPKPMMRRTEEDENLLNQLPLFYILD